jgi:hypothetical protein
MSAAIPPNKIGATVREIVQRTAVRDIHTHLYDPAFGPLLLWGIDELIVYHYLIAESFRYFDFPYEKFWAASKTQQADWIWQKLFIEHSPISEACRGVLTTLNCLGLDVKKRDLPALRKWFSKFNSATYTTHCMGLAGVESICMTNSPFDDLERPVWEKGFKRDERFEAALRIDPILVDWKKTSKTLAGWGYKVSPTLNAKTIAELRRFFEDWSERIHARYLMVSLTPEFEFPAKDDCARIIAEAVLPHCRDHGLPFALMLGVRRQVNPNLRLAGDGVGRSDLEALQNLCAAYPENKFLVTVLSRENQHELCVLARKFRNLHIFGCWWFTNVPEIINEMTQMRLELIGLSVTPQHSDARVLDQIIYKWDHSRAIIGQALAQKYEAVAATGWQITREEIERDVRGLFGGEFQRFCGA